MKETHRNSLRGNITLQSQNSFLKQLGKVTFISTKDEQYSVHKGKAADIFNAVTQEIAARRGNKAHIESYISPRCDGARYGGGWAKVSARYKVIPVYCN